MKRSILALVILLSLAINAQAASRFWVGGTGTWDNATTTHWSATTGGAGGVSVPGAADDVVFDSNSGGGTVTVNFGGTITILSLTVGNFTGTWDNSVNNNNFVLTLNGGGGGIAFNNNNSGTRTINLGSATYTLSGVSASFQTGVSGLTLNATSSTIAFTGTSGTRNFNGGPKDYGTVTFAGNPTSSSTGWVVTGFQGGSVASLVVNAPLMLMFQIGGPQTVTSLSVVGGSSSSQVFLLSDSFNSLPASVAVGSASISWAAIKDLAFTGSPTATNSFNLGNNSGITITGPGGGGATTACILGGWLLWRDMPNNLNDNFPAWLDKAA